MLHLAIIDSFRHRGLRRLYERGDGRDLNPQHVEKITLVLTTLDAALTIEAMDLPSFRLHRLTGDLQECWSVTVRANWRIVFRFEDGMARNIDLVDYHYRISDVVGNCTTGPLPLPTTQAHDNLGGREGERVVRLKPETM